MSNPPNNYTTPALWRLWEEISAVIGYRVKYGGIYANKSGYHNTRDGNKAKWPSNYSIQLDLDKLGPSNKAAAIDLTFSSVTDMIKYTKRISDAFSARDARLASVKEFYGTLDGKVVHGLGKKSRVGKPYETSADKSHLWHLHVSFFRADVENWDRIKGVFEVLTGKTAGSATPAQDESLDMTAPTYGEKSWRVEQMQRRFETLGYELDGGHDGAYGPSTKAVVKKWFKDCWDKDWHGDSVTPWMWDELLLQFLAKRGLKGVKGDPGPAGKDGVLKLPASFAGTVTLTASKLGTTE
ncbi:peptidoglycan-binding protein [Glycomyces mayteni]|uniref:Peptidoglycan-binding protein n=1 Tax=Glycomyces mayteni TaxID=543887 RepID=A0ABW2D1D2_9ACTN|nr:hypothetical protein GCM10025732_48420 [Glycomyces mayteni]